MSIADQIANPQGVWRGAPPASKEFIAELVAKAPIKFPITYLELLLVSNGGEGDISVEPGWFAPWPAQEVMQHNAGYQVADNLPGFFGFGSNGAGELLAFDARRSQPWPVVMVPFIPMETNEVVQIARDFDEFAKAIGASAKDR